MTRSNRRATNSFDEPVIVSGSTASVLRYLNENRILVVTASDFTLDETGNHVLKPGVAFSAERNASRLMND